MLNLLTSKKNKIAPMADFSNFIENNFAPFNEAELSAITGGCEEPSVFDYDRFNSLDIGEEN